MAKIQVRRRRVITPPSQVDIWVRAAAAGTADGSSLANAKAFSGLASIITGAAAGKRIGIYSGDVYTAQSFNIASSNGTAGNRVQIKGVDASGNPAYARIVGTRTNFSFPVDPETVTSVVGWTTGEHIFTLTNAAASHLQFSYLQFERVSTPFDHTHTSGIMSDLQYDHINTLNTFCGVDHNQADNTNACEINGINILNWTTDGFSNHFIRMRGKDNTHYAHNILIQDCDLNSHRQDGSNFASGCHFYDYAQDIVIRRVTAYNCHDSRGGNSALYWNGEGFSAEETVNNILFDSCVSHGNTDAGFDVKGSNIVYTNCVAYDNKRNFRCWFFEPVYNNCNSYSPRGRGGTSSDAPLALWCGQGVGNPGNVGPIVRWHSGGTINGSINIGQDDTVGAAPTALALLNVTEPAPADSISPGSVILRSASAIAGSPVLSNTLNGDGTIHVRCAGGVTPGLPALSWDRPVFYVSVTGGATIASRATGALNYTAPAYTGVPANDQHDLVVTVEDVDGSQSTVTIRVIVMANMPSVYIAVAADNGATLSGGEQTLLTNFFATSGIPAILAKLDRLFFLAQENEAAALSNFIFPTRVLSKVNSLTFTANRGYKGDGISGHLVDNLGWQYISGGQFGMSGGSDPGFGNRRGTMGCWCNLQGTGTSSRPQIGGDTVNTHFNIQPRSDSLADAVAVFGSGVSSSHLGTDRKGHRTAKRTSATIIHDYLNGASLGDISCTELAVQSLPCLFRANTQYGDDRLAVFYAGAVLSDGEVTTLHNALNTYLTAKGAN